MNTQMMLYEDDTKNLSALSDAELDMAVKKYELSLTKLIRLQMERHAMKLKELEEASKKQEAKLKLIEQEQANQVQEIKEEIDKTKNMAAASQRVHEPRYGWVNQGDFGRFFSISIGSKTMGKLLKVVGLAMKAKGPTTPYRRYIPKYAMTTAYENYTSVRWHYENCIEFIDQWLKEHGYFEAFYSIKNTREMEKFINTLYERYVI